MNKKLKTLEQNNQEAYDGISNIDKPQLNGIECPRCGKELYDSNPYMVLTSYPPQKQVHCGNCDYRGTRIV